MVHNHEDWGYLGLQQYWKRSNKNSIDRSRQRLMPQVRSVRHPEANSGQRSCLYAHPILAHSLIF
ncbi:hypothetical protein T06_10116 [Trichinella sp. T6]|nr:hypothetical protein T06_10116 [Trichinella sp. T6]